MLEALVLQNSESTILKVKGYYFMPSLSTMFVNRLGVGIEILLIERTFRVQLSSIDGDKSQEPKDAGYDHLEHPELFSATVKDGTIETVFLKFKGPLPRVQYSLENNTGVDLSVISKAGTLVIDKPKTQN